MPIDLTLHDGLIRFFCSLVGGFLIGLDRSRQGESAGLRTNILVVLAASLSMILMNTLLDLRGKTPDSFAVMDLMRLPLGILSGIGFIGGGAILRRENITFGVTTAATLWLDTVIGLCFGAGDILWGWIGVAACLFVLWILRPFEAWLPRSRIFIIRLGLTHGSTNKRDILQLIESSVKTVKSIKSTEGSEFGLETIECQLKWIARDSDVRSPPLIADLQRLDGVRELSWQVSE